MSLSGVPQNGARRVEWYVVNVGFPSDSDSPGRSLNDPLLDVIEIDL